MGILRTITPATQTFHFPDLGGRATASETMEQWRQSEILDETGLTIPGTTFCFVTSRQH